MTFIRVYQAYQGDGLYTGVYRTEEEARAQAAYPDHSFAHNTRSLIAVDDGQGQIWLCNGPHRFTEDLRAKRAAALAKLTDEEQVLLGLKAAP